MAHAHSHEDKTAYFLEQISNIAISALLGGVAVMMFRQGMLNVMLATWAHLPVVIAGGTLIGLVLVRAVAVWLEAGVPAAAGEKEHQHGPGCSHEHHDHGDHDHGDHAHDHTHGDSCGDHGHGPSTPADCGHDHSWAGWRYALLLLPVVLYFLNLPNTGFSNDQVRKDAQSMVVDDVGQVEVAAKESTGSVLEFKELERAASNEELRSYFSGRSGKLRGQFVFPPNRTNDKVFSLIRYRMNCCTADAVPVGVAIISPENLRTPEFQWVEVSGQIQFRKRLDKNEYLPVLQLRSAADVVPIPPETNPFLQ